MSVISLHIHGPGHHETFALDDSQIRHEYHRQLLRRPIENDNDPEFVPDNGLERHEDKLVGTRRAPALTQRLKRFGRFQEILDTPGARIERSRWRAMPPVTFVAPHPRRCVCHRCLKLQQSVIIDTDDGHKVEYPVPSYVETAAGWLTVQAAGLTGLGPSLRLTLAGQAFVLVKRRETDARTGNSFTYDAWAEVQP